MDDAMQSSNLCEEILSSLTPGWNAIFSELAAVPDPALVKLLRPRIDEVNNTRTTSETDLIARLDGGLQALCLLELAAVTNGLPRAVSIAIDLPLKLTKSAAFGRYVNYYLYFGVRFLADRLWPDGDGEVDAQCNLLPFALHHPPDFKDEKFIVDIRDFVASSQTHAATDSTSEAMNFLDDFRDSAIVGENAAYELWLRHLPSPPVCEQHFALVTEGLLEWIRDRSAFYEHLEAAGDGLGELPLGWMAHNPLTARCGIVDFFWLARLLRAEVSSEGQVRYTDRQKSWIELLAGHFDYMGELGAAQALRRAERILRGVFDYASDVVQNSVEVTSAFEMLKREPERFPKLSPEETVGWRQAFDEELLQIARQRPLRTSDAPQKPFAEGQRDRGTDPKKPIPRRAWWSRRTVSGDYPEGGVIGLAISGGGIRSATFGLGILEGLQEFDLLRSVDYLSTVSGGGYIGSWLVANVLRTPYWLGRQTSWGPSIAHLRKHARYLAPHGGLLSADSWTIFGIWSRNALLVQLTGAAWLLTALAACLMAKPLFDAIDGCYRFPWLGWPADQVARATSGLLLVMISLFTGWNLYRTEGIRRDTTSPGWGEKAVLWLIVMPAWAVAFLTAALMWSAANGHSSNASPVWREMEYSKILLGAWKPWWPLLAVLGAVFAFLGGFTMKPAKTTPKASDKPTHTFADEFKANPMGFVRIGLGSLASAFFSTGVLYLIFCAIMWTFRRWAGDPSQHGWFAMVFGPAMVTIAVATAVVIFIGLSGRSSPEGSREWWTRMGSWLGMTGLAFLSLGVASVLSPWWLLLAFGKLGTLKLASVGGIVGTIVSALFSGNSSKTGGHEQKSFNWREYLARFGAVLFIVSGLFAVAMLLHAFFVNAATTLPVDAASYWTALDQIPLYSIFIVTVVMLVLGLLLSWRVDLNIFGLNNFYRNRLVRCYLGASRWRPGMRKPNRFTDFDEADDIELRKLKANDPALAQTEVPLNHRPFRGPLPIVNCTVNLGGSSDLGVVTRQSASFSMTPLRCGSDRDRVGFAPTDEYEQPVLLGHAIAVSGAAASPNMGYSTSALVSFLLTMFNVRLGWWFPNPSGSVWKRGKLSWKGFGYLAEELFGVADERSDYLNISDGGHFENLGIYELVRRRARVIIASDGECDENLQFGSLGNLLRICETDFGATIDIDVSSINKQQNGFSRAHCAVGRILYSNGSRGWLIYLKSSLAGDEDVAILQYQATHPAFPHESTGDQFFTEDQFESYRRLGRHIVRHAFRGTEMAESLPEVAERLYDTWAPAGFSSESFLQHTRALDAMWEKFRNSPNELSALLNELSYNDPVRQPAATTLTEAELCACLELTQLMENVFIDLRLDDFWAHADNRGWAMLFSGWARSAKFQKAWTVIHRTYGIRFEYFCASRLGLEKETPVARV